MQANMQELCKGRTTLVVAHRLSTIMSADQIFVLGKCSSSDGTYNTVVESGTHQELLDAKGVYAEMWQIQSASENTFSIEKSIRSQMFN